jgi:multidrug efflux pump subunit AcrA (membrane-fusion protein)
MRASIRKQQDALATARSNAGGEVEALAARSSAQAAELANLKERYTAQFAASKQQVEAAEARARQLRTQLQEREAELQVLRSSQGQVLDKPQLPDGSAEASGQPGSSGHSPRGKSGGAGLLPRLPPGQGRDLVLDEVSSWATHLLSSFSKASVDTGAAL